MSSRALKAWVVLALVGLGVQLARGRVSKHEPYFSLEAPGARPVETQGGAEGPGPSRPEGGESGPASLVPADAVSRAVAAYRQAMQLDPGTDRKRAFQARDERIAELEGELARLGSAGVPPIADAIAREAASDLGLFRFLAAGAGRGRSEEARALLLGFLRGDPDFNRRRLAARLLGEHFGPSSREVFLERLSAEPDQRVRLAIFTGLLLALGPGDVELLVGLLTREAQDWLACARLLCEHRPDLARLVLVKLIADGATDEQRLGALVTLLADLVGPDGLAELERLWLPQRPEVLRLALLDGFVRTRSPLARELVSRLGLADAAQAVREHAARLLTMAHEVETAPRGPKPLEAPKQLEPVRGPHERPPTPIRKDR